MWDATLRSGTLALSDDAGNSIAKRIYVNNLIMQPSSGLRVIATDAPSIEFYGSDLWNTLIDMSYRGVLQAAATLDCDLTSLRSSVVRYHDLRWNDMSRSVVLISFLRNSIIDTLIEMRNISGPLRAYQTNSVPTLASILAPLVNGSRIVFRDLLFAANKMDGIVAAIYTNAVLAWKYRICVS
jgi:hypothetical protein